MNPGRHERVRDLFMKIAELPPAARHDALNAECGDDRQLKSDVLSLLAHDDEDEDRLLTSSLVDPRVLPRNLAPPPAFAPGELPRGSRLARYTVDSLLGTGGMGAVYRATQDHPHRTVALKLIRSDPANPGLRRRIELEAELLGRLSHAGIASVFEAGYATIVGSDVPYFAMELVEGIPLTSYVRRESLPVSGRLNLAIQVCDAVSHAHQRGVIHRDLKPANILVTDEGVLKVVDFGIARVVSSDRHDASSQTLPGQVIGTLGYMSPEQLDANPAAIGPQTDVYAIGVILYELLTGRLPFDPSDRPLSEFAEIVRTKSPPPIGQLDRAYRGDLEIIVAQALAPDLARRYRSAEALADDLRRFLEHRPIAARRDSALYLLRQLARRHTAAAALSLALLVGLLVFGIIASSLALRNERLASNLMRSLYASRVGQAQGSLQSGDIPRAKSLLAALPSELRGWEYRHLIRRTDQSIRAIDVGAPAVDVAFSPDSTLIAVACSGAPIRMIRVADGATVWSQGSKEGYTTVEISHDGRFVTGKVHAGPFDVFDAASGKLVKRVEVPKDPPVAFGEPILRHAYLLPDSSTIIGFRSFGMIYRWGLDDALPQIAFNTKQREAGLAALSPDGAALALSTGIRTVEAFTIWNTATGAQLRTTNSMPPVQRAAFSPDSKLLGLALFDGGVAVWDWASNDPARRIGAHEVAATAVAFSHSGRLLASGGTDSLLKVWTLSNTANPVVQVGHPDSVRAIAFNHDDSLIATAANDHLVRFWNVEPEPLVPTLRVAAAPITCIETSRNHAHVLLGDKAGAIIRADADATRHQLIGTLPEGGVRSIAELSNGTVLVGGERGAVYRFAPNSTEPPVTLSVFSVQPTYVVLAPDDSFIAVRGTGPQLAILDPLAQSVRREFDLGVRLTTVDVSNAHVLAVGTRDREVRFMTAEGTTAFPPIQLPDVPHSVAFHPSGESILIVGTQHGWSVRRVRDGVVLARQADDDSGPRSAVFIDDGSRLASISNDRAVRIWRWDTADELCSLIGHDAPPMAIRFDAASGRLFSADSVGVLRVWHDADPPTP